MVQTSDSSKRFDNIKPSTTVGMTEKVRQLTDNQGSL